MRFFCRIFCALAFLFTILYVVQVLLHPPDIDEESLSSLIKTLLIGAVLYGLYWFIRRLRINPALWRIIYALMILIVVLVILGVPELRELLLGWLDEISDPAENLLVLAILCLIICVLCRTRPARSPTSSN
jgi:hypothetical protein